MENIRFSKTPSEYHEQPYPLEKTTTVLYFLIQLEKCM